MIKNYNEIAGEAIRSYRKANSMSQKELADIIDIPSSSLAKMENGDQRVDTGLLVKIADVFDISIDEMLKRSIKEKNSLVKSEGVINDFTRVLENYLDAVNETYEGHELGAHIRRTIPKNIQEEASLNPSEYSMKGSNGQTNWAEIPWVAVFLKSITNKASKGFYIVFLFKADMSGFYVSLNQGWTFFEENYSAKTRTSKIRLIVNTIREKLHTVPENVSLKEISLQGSGGLSQGYEKGHIYGKYYSIDDLPTSDELLNDLNDLLIMYKEIEGLMGGRTVEQFNDFLLAEDDQQFIETEDKDLENKFQDSVQNKLDNVKDSDDDEEEEQSEPRPDPLVGKGGNKKWPRSSSVAAKALRLSNFVCAYDETIPTFISKKSGKPFLEIHHLVPMSLQDKFEVKLDKVNNILCLTPYAHRLIHHGTDNERKEMLRVLYNDRKESLSKIDINISFEELLEAYGIEN